MSAPQILYYGLVEATSISFTIATYNILAHAYIRPEMYPRTPPELLDPTNREPALTRHIADLGADLVCLQEVESSLFPRLLAALEPVGYAGLYAAKGHGKPDGCATLYRWPMFTLVNHEAHAYNDDVGNGSASGHIAQIVTLQSNSRTVCVANTHLKWSPPDTPRYRHYGCVQMSELLSRLAYDGLRVPRVICGDFNVTPDSAVIQILHREGFRDTFEDDTEAFTCNANGRAKRLDYLFHSSALASRPHSIAVIGDNTPLPGQSQPSDHLAVVATMEWIEGDSVMA